jgi:glycine/D-amino acid oxidase-like deaminating enzyme/nitrite reductase/ring-hydroxylating ferredoxin subunit
MTDVDAKAYWDDSSSMPRFAPLDRDLTVDVVVIGAGITGLTTAYLLKRAGRTVAVIDRARCGGVDTGSTTAHVTYVTDTGLLALEQAVGRDHAHAVWDAGQASLDQIEAIVDAEDIDCEWHRVTGYKHLAADAPAGEADDLRAETEAAAGMGLDATFQQEVPLVGRPGIAFAGQALFHPRQYLAALARLIHGHGSYVFEHTESTEVCDTPLTVTAAGHTLSCGYVVLATHTPLMGAAGLPGALALQTKLYLYTSYAIAGRVPLDGLPEASFWDTADPYHYLRIERHRSSALAIFGGEDRKTGQEPDPAARFEALERTLRALLPSIDVTHRWSGQVIETPDGLPFIGETAEHQFAATGFGGNGMTFGTLAATMAVDRVLERPNPWSDLFDIGRTRIRAGAWNYVKENLDYPYYMIRDRLKGPQAASLDQVRRGEGQIIDLDGDAVAAYRSPTGSLTLLSPVCTHMGCRVQWNDTEGTWECPCHGSRFKARGQVIAGPAETPLQEYRKKEDSTHGS